MPVRRFHPQLRHRDLLAIGSQIPPSCPRRTALQDTACRRTVRQVRAPSDRPSPVPLPTPLVVKNGSCARWPGSPRPCRCRCRVTESATYGRRARSPIRPRASRAGDGDRAAVGHRVARVHGQIEERELELVARPPSPAAGRAETASRYAMRANRALSSVGHAADQFADSQRSPASAPACARRPACAGSGRAALRALHRVVEQALELRIVRGSRFLSSSRLPRTAMSRLLKSCATPPVSWPTASIFWA